MASSSHRRLLGTEVIHRAPFEGVEAYSGARFEQVELADGRRLVIKHLPPEGDWLTHVTGGIGRVQLLWHNGLLGAVAPAVEHGVLDVVPFDDHDALVMEDLSDRLWPTDGTISLELARDGLDALGRLHDLGEQIVASGRFRDLELCSVGARYGMFTPQFHATYAGPGPHPFGEYIVAGWDVFWDSVDPDVAAAVHAVHANPESLGDAMADRCDRPILLHGDAKPGNLGLEDGRLVAVDWGELTGFGPHEVDVAWFALQTARIHLHIDPGDVFAAYEAAGRSLDPDLVHLACIGSMAQVGFNHANWARNHSDTAMRAHHTARLAWWERRVLAALDRGAMP